ncbi:MAG: Mpo1-like protein [Thermoanaerobaculia bacterium]
MSAAPRIPTFEELWPFYASQHRRSGTRFLHFVGTSLGLVLLVAAAAAGKPFLLLWGLVAAYGFAWIGHYFIEKNRPATFQYPLWSLAGDLKMYGLMWRGRMGAELERLGLAGSHAAA